MICPPSLRRVQPDMFPEATAFHFFSVFLLEKSVGLLLLLLLLCCVGFFKCSWDT